MSFVNKNSFNPNNKSENTLQHRGLNKIIERAFSSSLRLRGVLTIEAAVIIPLFLFFILGISSLMLILGLQVSIQTELENTARSLGQKAYYLDKTDTVAVGLNPVVTKASVLTDGLGEMLEKSSVEGGKTGLSFAFTTYDADTGILDLVTTYQYSIPFLPSSFSTLYFTQRCRTHTWIGRELDTAGEDGDTNEKKTVFITETGAVYHLSKDCTYLDLSISAVNINMVSDMRNKSGAKYYPCPLCGNVAGSETVYVTDYGTNYHTNLGCSGLKRTIIEVDISEVGDMPACSKCGGG